MATVKPFAALRPKPELASRICELPYDVMSSAEARQMADGNALSFLHVSKPEIDLPAGTDLYSPEVYAKGKQNFLQLISNGSLYQDKQPCYYLYRQVMGQHSQIGLVAASSCEEYLNGVIKKHEFTRPDKEDDRVRHIESLNSQTGPVFLTYRALPALDQLFATLTAGTPDVDFTGNDNATPRGRSATRRRSRPLKPSSRRSPPFTSPTGIIAARRRAACSRAARARGTAARSSR
jgi:uncharacterized protein (DUF1015 family)